MASLPKQDTARQSDRYRLGEKLHSDTKTRQVRGNGNSDRAVVCNLTEFARDYFGLEKGQQVVVEVREDGIAIIPIDVDDIVPEEK